MTQTSLAASLGLSYSTINRWERNLYEPTRTNREMLEAFCRKRNIDYETIQVGMMLLQVVANLDQYTAQHCFRVGELVERISRNVPGINATDLKVAAILHDAGKIFVNPTLVKSRRIYDTNMRQRMAEHAPAGRVLLSLLMAKHPHAADFVDQHHCRLSGGPADRKISPEARLLAVCDVFDALTTARSYKPAKTVETAIAMLCADKGLDQQMVSALVRNLRRNGFLDALEDDNHLFVYDARDKFYRRRAA